MTDHLLTLADLEGLSPEELERTKTVREILATEAERRKRDAEADKTEFTLAVARENHEHNSSLPMENRTYTLHGPVTGQTVAHAIQRVTAWANHDPDAPVRFVLNSQGGSVTDGLSLYDTLMDLRESGIHVTTVGTGKVASMAGVLLQAGTERILHPNSFVLIHEVSSMSMGKTSRLADDFELVKTMQSRLLNILAERSTMTVEEIKEHWERKDWWLTADEALDLGFTDEVGYGL